MQTINNRNLIPTSSKEVNNRTLNLKQYRWILLCFVLFISQGVFAQTYQLEGYVKDNKNNPLENLAININESTIHSDDQGYFIIKNLKSPKVTIQVRHIGFEPYQRVIELQPGNNSLPIILSEHKQDIDEVRVTGLTKVQEVNRQPFSVNALDATKFHNSTFNLSQAMDKVPGVRIRENGGVGSNMALSLNGFSGNHIRIFLDGVPMDNFGSSFQLNNIPVNLAERIEVYKGVVPIWLGSDALGGAINIVTGSAKRNYIDASYSYGSFNTHRSVINASMTSKKGFLIQLNAFQNYSDNNYKVYLESYNNRRDDYTKPTTVPRFHDQYHNETVIANIGLVNKPFADQLTVGIVLGENYKQIQTGARMESVFGAWHRRGNIVMPTLKYQKNNLVKGLDVIINANINLGTEQNIDTVNRRFDWFGDMGVELPATSGERSRSMYKYRNYEGILTSNFNYALGEHHTFTLNNVFNSFNREGKDPLFPQNDQYEYAKLSQKNVLGFGYQYNVANLWSITVFTKHLYQLNKNGDLATTHTDNFGYGTAGTYFFNKALQLKASYELTNRMPTPYEIFGDLENQDANPDLQPEHSNNVNLGVLYDFTLGKKHHFNLNTGLLYRNATNFIYQRLNLNQSKYIADNRDGVRTVGGDVELRYSYNHWLSAGTNWTYQYLQNMQKYDEGMTAVSAVYKDQMPNIPYLFANADVNALFRNIGARGNNLNVGYNLSYVHEFYLYWPSQGGLKNKIPKQVSHDINLVYSLHNGRYNIGLEARNISNERIYDNFSLQKPGRAFYANLRYFIKTK